MFETSPWSFWYWLGRWYGLYRYGRRRDAERREAATIAVEAALVAEIGQLIADVATEVAKEIGRQRSQHYRRFQIVPLSKQYQLAMPETEPVQCERYTRVSPPFTGVRIALGET